MLTKLALSLQTLRCNSLCNKTTKNKLYIKSQKSDPETLHLMKIRERNDLRENIDTMDFEKRRKCFDLKVLLTLGRKFGLQNSSEEASVLAASLLQLYIHILLVHSDAPTSIWCWQLSNILLPDVLG
jgi:hypothetical protein